jgi:Fe-S oxidoreductase
MNLSDAEIAKSFERCTACDACLRSCPSFHGLDSEFVKDLAKSLGENRIDVDDAMTAYSCNLCGFCTTQCPWHVDVKGLMVAVRNSYVRSGQGPLAAHTPLYVNKRVNFFSLLDGSSHKKKEYPKQVDRIFFPGCSMRAYRPEAVDRVAHLLGDAYVMKYDCCGKPLKMIGETGAYEEHHARVLEQMKSMNPSEVITSCPNCYNMFKPDLNFAKLRFAAEALLEEVQPSDVPPRTDLGTVTIHDSCPYRDNTELIDLSRKFVDKFYPGQRVEMKHSKKNTLCCGAGGAVSYANEDLAKVGALERLGEAKSFGADTVVTFCNSCGVQFGSSNEQAGVKVIHAFDLLDPSSTPDYAKMYDKSKSVFSGVCLLENVARLTLQV